MIEEVPEFNFALDPRLIDRQEFLPKASSAGWDVLAAPIGGSIKVRLFETVAIPIGFRVLCPKNWTLELRPNINIFSYKHLHSISRIIDNSSNDYVSFVLQYIPPGFEVDNYSLQSIYDARPLTINAGDVLGKIFPVKIQPMRATYVSDEQFDKLVDARRTINV